MFCKLNLKTLFAFATFHLYFCYANVTLEQSSLQMIWVSIVFLFLQKEKSSLRVRSNLKAKELAKGATHFC